MKYRKGRGGCFIFIRCFWVGCGWVVVEGGFLSYTGILKTAFLSGDAQIPEIRHISPRAYEHLPERIP